MNAVIKRIMYVVTDQPSELEYLKLRDASLARYIDKTGYSDAGVYTYVETLDIVPHGDTLYTIISKVEQVVKDVDRVPTLEEVRNYPEEDPFNAAVEEVLRKGNCKVTSIITGVS